MRGALLKSISPMLTAKNAIDIQVKLGTVKTPGFSFPVVTGRTYAVKLIQKKFIMEKKNKEIVFRERKILEKLKHPFIVTLHYTFQTDPALSASPLPSPTQRGSCGSPTLEVNSSG